MRPNVSVKAHNMKRFSHYSSATICLGLLTGVGDVFAAEPTAEGLAFFEKKIRPVLVEHCYKCHSASSEKVKGELVLDTREGIRKGGESGHAVVPKYDVARLAMAVDRGLAIKILARSAPEMIMFFEKTWCIARKHLLKLDLPALRRY